MSKKGTENKFNERIKFDLTKNVNDVRASAATMGVRVLLAMATATTAAATLQGCSPTSIEDQIKITPIKNSYKEFGIAPETLKGVKEIEALGSMEQEKVTNVALIDFCSSVDFSGKKSDGRIFQTRYEIETEKIANAINRKLRQDKGIEYNGEGEENLPKYFDKKDIRICVEQDPDNNNAPYYAIYVKNKGEEKVLFNSKKGSKNPIDKNIVAHLDVLFALKECDYQFSDFTRKNAFSLIAKNIEEIEKELSREYCYEDGKLKEGNPVKFYPFGKDEVKDVREGE